jgi:hypothetical protein
MEIKKIEKSKVIVQTSKDFDSTLIVEFYKKAFPERFNSLQKNWQWLNRIEFYDYSTPYLMIYKNQLIGHNGIMPFHISISGNKQTCAFFFDFIILPELQGQGLGGIIIKKSMTLSDYSIAINCNEKSISVNNKLGWSQLTDSYRHFNLLRPLSYPNFSRFFHPVICTITNSLTYPLFYLFYRIKSYPQTKYRLDQLNEDSFYRFFDLYNKSPKDSENTISPIRDMDYAKWRVLNSPNKNKYYIYFANEFGALVSLNESLGKYIDILWVSDTGNKIEIAKMISTLGIYGLKKSFAYIRFYTTKKDLSKFLKSKTRSIVRHPLFTYYSKTVEGFDKVKTAVWDFELIDSDFEII